MKVLKPESRLAFNETELDVYHINGERWLGAFQIATALGYSEPGSIRGLYRRHRDEFGEDETQIISVQTISGIQQIRVFSQSGAELLAIHAKTPIAKQFRLYLRKLTAALRDGTLSLNAQPAPAQIGTAALERKLIAANAELLRSNRTWNRIAGYRGMGLSHRDIAKLLDLDKSTIRVHVRRMEACGILTPPANLAALQGNVVNFARLERPAPNGAPQGEN